MKTDSERHEELELQALNCGYSIMSRIYNVDQYKNGALPIYTVTARTSSKGMLIEFKSDPGENRVSAYRRLKTKLFCTIFGLRSVHEKTIEEKQND